MIDQLEQPSGPGYALLDVGDARRLERFGGLTLDRPAPSAEGHLARDPAAWARADGRYDREDRGRVGHERWTTRDGAPIEPWNLRDDELAFELRLAGGGQVGYFPEQAANRRWIGRQVRRIAATSGPPPAVLNLFGYTGASTVAALAAGASATHVDAARSAVAWARRNAALNGLTEAPVRWISDDAIAFAERELRRGRRYAGVVLDPPSYGHGTGGHAWRLAPGLPALLATCAELLQDGAAFIVLTAHTPGFGPERLGEALLEA
ncbi:MAG: class I SAM-dependent methyltransferase, partial [Candidatus Limnocylindrales bacterium]